MLPPYVTDSISCHPARGSRNNVKSTSVTGSKTHCPISQPLAPFSEGRCYRTALGTRLPKRPWAASLELPCTKGEQGRLRGACLHAAPSPAAFSGTLCAAFPRGSRKAPVQQSCGFHVQVSPKGCPRCLQHAPWPKTSQTNTSNLWGWAVKTARYSTLPSSPPATSLHKPVRQQRGKGGALAG